MQENVVKILKENMWDLATCANNEPNVVTVAFKDVTEDGKLIVGDVFLETTEKSPSRHMMQKRWRAIRSRARLRISRKVRS